MHNSHVTLPPSRVAICPLPAGYSTRVINLFYRQGYSGQITGLSDPVIQPEARGLNLFCGLRVI